MLYNKREFDKSGMLGFATAIDASGALKHSISVRITKFLVCVYRSTQPTYLFSSSRYNKIVDGDLYHQLL